MRLPSTSYGPGPLGGARSTLLIWLGLGCAKLLKRTISISQKLWDPINEVTKSKEMFKQLEDMTFDKFGLKNTWVYTKLALSDSPKSGIK